jgi:hypothetical protein
MAHWKKIHRFRGPKDPVDSVKDRMRDRARVIGCLGGVCRKCKTRKRLDIHHVRRDGQAHRKGSPNVYADMLRDLSGYRLLCRRCHKNLHGKTWGGPETKADLVAWFSKLPWDSEHA